MVTGAHLLRLICLGALLSLSSLPAQDVASGPAGKVAPENVSVPAKLNVVDSDVLAARQAAAALVTPAIFRNYPSPTNAMARDFHVAFATTRALFATNLHGAFGDITNADATIAAPAFTNFVTAFNRKKIPFPISVELASAWTHGDSGEEIQARLLNTLLGMTQRPIRPDDVPEGFTLGETVRLAPVDSAEEELTLADAEQRGKLVKTTSVTTVTRLRDLFRRAFPQPEQAMARGVGKFLPTNSELDAALTREARERDIRQLTARLNLAAAPKAPAPKANLTSPAPPVVRNRNLWPLMAGAGVGVLGLGAFWIWSRTRRRPASLQLVRAEQFSPPPPELLPASLAPHLTQIVKDAVVQGLAAQRSELLQAQQLAAAEIGALVHRLDELKAPMQERLRSYEDRIAGLEKDLAERNEENRELLKLKIEMTRRQLEAERARNRVDFN